MADIQIERRPAIQTDRPDGIYIRLVGDDGERKGFLRILPKYGRPPFPDSFTVEIFKGNPITPDIDIKVVI